MGDAITTGLGEVVKVFTGNIVPLLEAEPFNYFLGAMLFGLGCGIFAKLKGVV